MENITIWHNPKCSKSRNALALIEEKNFEVNVIEYLQSNPKKEDIQNILSLLGLSAKDLLRSTEELCIQENLLDETNEEVLINAMVNNPILIQRPIIVRANKAVIARPFENLENLLK